MEKEGVREKISRWPRQTRIAGMVHQGVSVETATALEWRGGSEPAERFEMVSRQREGDKITAGHGPRVSLVPSRWRRRLGQDQ